MADADADHGAQFPTEAEIDAVLHEFGGDARAAIGALLHDLAVLAGDYETNVSYGFVRGGAPKIMIRRS